MYDAVQVFAKALHEVDLAENVKVPSLSCDSEEPWDYGATIIDYMKQLEFFGMTGMVRFDEEGRRTDFTLDVVEVYRDGVTKTAIWDSINGLSLVRSYNDTLAEVQRNVQDKIFIVASIIGEPYLTYTKPPGEYTGNDRFEGYSKDLIEAIADNLKFKGYQLILARDGKNGGIDPKTKKWNGLIREVLEMKADIAICDLTITYDRRSAVDFTMPFMNLGISILFSQLPKEPPNVFSFLKPFSFDVWLFMATAYLGVSIILFVLCRMTPYEWDNPHPCDPDPEELENSFNMLNCLWFSIGSLMAAGCDILPKAVSTRMLAGMWWFFVLILNASYTANLAAFLTNGRIEETIKSVQDLADQTKVKYGVMDGGSTAGFFSKSDNPLYQRMWVQMSQSKPSVFVKSNDEGVARVRKEKGKFAYFMESSTIGYQMHKFCDLIQVGMELDSKSYGIALPLNSPYRTLINKAILDLQESGNLSKIQTKWWEKAGGNCFKFLSGDSQDLEIRCFFSRFINLAFVNGDVSFTVGAEACAICASGVEDGFRLST
uniref:Glutamate receptor 1 n=1 Tax=Timema poppense TaxID=170557 RepID=A0A7R9D1P3_TIMPO|nr:unnamed protein product [Timema poppensis]